MEPKSSGIILLRKIPIILLLGSYDSETKSILEDIKEEIAKVFIGNVFAVVLEHLDIYIFEKTAVLTETFDKDKITLFIFREGSLSEMYDVDLENEPHETVYHFLKERYKVDKIQKLPIFTKLDLLMQFAKTIFLIRHKEETRGGEYIELMHALLKGHFSKVWFFKKEGIHLSAMLMEYLDKSKITMRPYHDLSSLKTGILRILEYW